MKVVALCFAKLGDPFYGLLLACVIFTAAASLFDLCEGFISRAIVTSQSVAYLVLGLSNGVRFFTYGILLDSKRVKTVQGRLLTLLKRLLCLPCCLHGGVSEAISCHSASLVISLV
jgi:hypothetical protein